MFIEVDFNYTSERVLKMAIKYKAEFVFYPKIDKQKIERESIKSVFVDGRRIKKETSRHKYFDSFQEAKAYLIELYECKVSAARSVLEGAKGHLGNAKGLKEF